MDLKALQTRIGSGLLSFPITDFGPDGEFDAAGYGRRLQWLSSFGAAGLFAAGGTGEFFSIGYDEYDAVIRTAVENSAPFVLVLVGVGFGFRLVVVLVW